MLCTNWHVMSGQNPLTGEVKGFPEVIRVFGYKRMSEPDAQGFFELRYSACDVALSGGPSDRMRWQEHPSLGMRVDVAVLDITAEVTGFEVAHVNELEDDAVLNALLGIPPPEHVLRRDGVDVVVMAST